MSAKPETREEKLARTIVQMGANWVYHPNYNKNKPAHHTTADRNSHTLRLVRQAAVLQGRL